MNMDWLVAPIVAYFPGLNDFLYSVTDSGYWDLNAVGTWVTGIAGLVLVGRALVALANRNIGRSLKIGGMGLIMWGATSVILAATQWADHGNGPQIYNTTRGVKVGLGAWAQMPNFVIELPMLVGALLVLIGVGVDSHMSRRERLQQVIASNDMHWPRAPYAGHSNANQARRPSASELFHQDDNGRQEASTRLTPVPERSNVVAAEFGGQKGDFDIDDMLKDQPGR